MDKTFFDRTVGFTFHLLDKFSDLVQHAVFTRDGGVSPKPYEFLNVRFGIGDRLEHVQQNREIIVRGLEKNLGTEGGKKFTEAAEEEVSHKLRLVSAEQTHSANVQIIDEEFLRYHPADREVGDCDALVTDFQSVALMMQVADCQALLMFDPVRRVVAAVHAGWKGLSQDISGETIAVLKARYGCDPANLLVGMSPSLGACCAEFTDPWRELPLDFHGYIDDKKRVDLPGYSVDQLEEHGVRPENIELSRVCTQCDPSQKYFSYRRDGGETGRFGAVILLKA